MEKKINLNNKFSGTIDLVLPAFNEENSIKKCIENFEALKIFNCIIVVDNNKSDLELTTLTMNRVSKVVRKFITTPVSNYRAKQWMKKELEARKR